MSEPSRRQLLENWTSTSLPGSLCLTSLVPGHQFVVFPTCWGSVGWRLALTFGLWSDFCVSLLNQVPIYIDWATNSIPSPFPLYVQIQYLETVSVFSRVYVCLWCGWGRERKRERLKELAHVIVRLAILNSVQQANRQETWITVNVAVYCNVTVLSITQSSRSRHLVSSVLAPCDALCGTEAPWAVSQSYHHTAPAALPSVMLKEGFLVKLISAL
jgi:hypothetical protein